MSRILILFFLLFSFPSKSQQKILIGGIMLSNDYEEYVESEFLDTTAFFSQLENILHNKLANVHIRYEGRKKVFFNDPHTYTSYSTAVRGFQQYYTQINNARQSNYEYLVEIESTIKDKHKGKDNNLQVISKVTVRNEQRKIVIKKSGEVSIISPLPEIDNAHFLANCIDILSAFPVRHKELTAALLQSIELAFEDDRKKEIISAGRSKVSNYDKFMEGAMRYRILARNDFLTDTEQTKVFELLTFRPKKNLLLTRLADMQGGMLTFGESKITDISFRPIDRQLLNVNRFQRNFKLGVTMKDIPEMLHSVRAVFTNIGSLYLGDNEIELTLKRKDEDGDGKLFFKAKHNSRYNSIIQFTRAQDRVFHPQASLTGTVSGRKIDIVSNPQCYNAVEVRIDDKLCGLITHPLTSRKFLRRGRQYLTYMLFLSPQLTIEEETLVLQTFNFNRLAYLVRNNQDLQLKKRSEVPITL